MKNDEIVKSAPALPPRCKNHSSRARFQTWLYKDWPYICLFLIIIGCICILAITAKKFTTERTLIKNEQKTLNARVDKIEKTMKYFSME